MHDMIRKTLALVALAGLAGACAPQANEADDGASTSEKGAGLVASLNLAGGTRVEFVETLPGLTVVVERGKYPQRPAVTGGLAELEPLALYRALSQGQSPPAALVAAGERQSQLATQLKPEALPPASREAPPILSTPAAAPASSGGVIAQMDNDELCPGDIFQTAYEGCGSIFLVEWHDCARWQHGNTTFYEGDIKDSHTGACSYRGTIAHQTRYRRFVKWGDPITNVLEAGEWEAVTRGRGVWDVDVESKVIDADPDDGYHHGGWGSKI